MGGSAQKSPSRSPLARKRSVPYEHEDEEKAQRVDSKETLGSSSKPGPQDCDLKRRGSSSAGQSPSSRPGPSSLCDSSEQHAPAKTEEEQLEEDWKTKICEFADKRKGMETYNLEKFDKWMKNLFPNPNIFGHVIKLYYDRVLPRVKAYRERFPHIFITRSLFNEMKEENWKAPEPALTRRR